MIHHRPILNVDKIAAFYTKKDGADVRYVCTSAMGGGTTAVDIFFRETPHPDFGNRYFMVFNSPAFGTLMIGNADAIEKDAFTMVLGDDGWEYSQHRHDYYTPEGAGITIDGGRAYFRCVGDMRNAMLCEFKIVDGTFEVVK